ncbi:hypothetical protein DB346_23630 [Verrucomicrobia bacterium LW23]|nr:hypothetical protein DB346_23630 [Verrucomicrobia bacterium LW23]
MNIPALRQKIDELDQRLLALLNERAELSSSVGRWKQAHQEPVFVPEREEALMRTLVAANRGPLTSSGLRAIYREILSSSRACQKAFSVACLGAAHSAAWHAVRLRFGASDRVVPVETASELLRALEEGDAEVALLSRSDLLKAYLPKKGVLRNELGTRLFICGEVRLSDALPDDAQKSPLTAEDLAHQHDARFELPAGDDDISFLSIPQAVVDTAFKPINGSHRGAAASEPESGSAVASLLRQTTAHAGDAVFFLLSRRPVPEGPHLKTLVCISAPRGEEMDSVLRELMSASDIITTTWDTLSHGSKPGHVCHHLELEGAVAQSVVEAALVPASDKITIKHLGFYPETQVYG